MPATGLAGLVLGLVALQGGDRSDPAELVAQLGATRYADREAAGEALVKIGRAALPALAKVRDSRDPEVRRRAEILVARIEAAEVLGATQVRLDIHDRPLAEAIDAISRGSGQSIKPGTSNNRGGADPGWPDVRVTLAAKAPVPFWEAVDRLCAAGGLQRVYPPAANSDFPFGSPFELNLVPGKARPPASDTGALRVELLRIRHQRARNYVGTPAAGPAFGRPAGQLQDAEIGAIQRASYTADLLVSAEPRLRIIGVGAVERAEVVDDRSRSLLAVPTPEEQEAQLKLWQANPHLDPALHPELRYGSGWRTSMKTWVVPLPLAYPAPRAHRIVKMRGVIPVVGVSRRPDPLEIDLKHAAGKVFTAGSTRITVHEAKAESGREPTVDLTLETAPADGGQTISVQDSQGSRLAVNQPSDLMQLQLEVVDARGDYLFWQFTRTPTGRTQGRMAIIIHGRNRTLQALDGLRLRYWELIGAATDLPFAFDDVPTP